MSSCRLATAVAVLAFLAGRAAAQVADPVDLTTDPIAIADAAAPTEAETSTPPVKVSPVPEPGTIMLLAGPAAIGWVAYWRRKWRADSAAKGPTTLP